MGRKRTRRKQPPKPSEQETPKKRQREDEEDETSPVLTGPDAKRQHTDDTKQTSDGGDVQQEISTTVTPSEHDSDKESSGAEEDKAAPPAGSDANMDKASSPAGSGAEEDEALSPAGSGAKEDEAAPPAGSGAEEDEALSPAGSDAEEDEASSPAGSGNKDASDPDQKSGEGACDHGKVEKGKGKKAKEGQTKSMQVLEMVNQKYQLHICTTGMKVKDFIAAVKQQLRQTDARGLKETLKLEHGTVEGFVISEKKTFTKHITRYLIDPIHFIYKIRNKNKGEAELYQRLLKGIYLGHYIMPLILGFDKKSQTYYLPDYGETLQQLSGVYDKDPLKKSALALTLFATKATAQCNHSDDALKNICVYHPTTIFKYVWHLSYKDFIVVTEWCHQGLVMPIDWQPQKNSEESCSSTTTSASTYLQTSIIKIGQAVEDLVGCPEKKPYNYVGATGKVCLLFDALVKGADVIKRCEIFKRKSCTRTMSALEIVPCAELVQDTNNAISSKVTTMCGKLGKVEDLDPKVVDKKLERIYTTILRYQLPCSEIPSDTGKAYYHKGSLNAAVDIRKGEFITRFSAVKANEMGVDYHLVSNIATLMVPLRVAVPYGGIGAFVRLTLNDKEVNCELETVCEFLSLVATKDIPKGQEIVLKGIDRKAFKDLQFVKICSTVMDVEEFLHTKLCEEREMMTRAKHAARTTEEQEEEQEEEM